MCNKALTIHPTYAQALFRKATALAFLADYEESRAIFRQIEYGEEMIDVLKAQEGGDYTKVIANFSGSGKTYRQS